ncbi:hypothetical protein T484DRAFT_1614080, partial [Baffinella frigidus]
THSLAHSRTHPPRHALTHARTHARTHSLTHALTHAHTATLGGTINTKKSRCGGTPRQVLVQGYLAHKKLPPHRRVLRNCPPTVGDHRRVLGIGLL